MSAEAQVGIAVFAVGAASLLFRLVPLLFAPRLPDRAAQQATWAGLAVLAGVTVRSVLNHHDQALVTGSVNLAPLVAAFAVGMGLSLAYRGRSVLVCVAVGIAGYVGISTVLLAL